jgi:alpha/beta superfamily hydrolase
MNEFPQTKQQALFLDGPMGQLEVLTNFPTSQDETKFVANAAQTTALICHPNPLYQGTMTNKVVVTLAKALNQLGIKTIRFNYRGVGQSDGFYGNGEGEADDALAIVDWIKTVCPNDDLWMVGFSFGGYVATRTAVEVKPKELITVAPSVENFDFIELQNELGKVSCPWLVLQGEADEVVKPQAVYDLVAQQQPVPTLIRFPDVGHFFHGSLVELREAVVEYYKLP